MVRRKPHVSFLFVDVKKGGIVAVCYLRFLNSFVPSISVMYSNPCSIRSVASCMVLAVLHVYSSSSVKLISCV